MAKHYLDPNQTEGPHDVETRRLRSGRWGYALRDGRGEWSDADIKCHRTFATEAEALAAARKAAGYETEE